jgi:NADH:ubiquinone oxidoreductase subunit 3 (subunit A)
MTDTLDVIIGPMILIIADIVVLSLVGRLGFRSSGKGGKYKPFTGGEKAGTTRGTYQSSLFVFAVIFLVVEAFALLLAGSFLASGPYYPLLFLTGGGAVLTITVWWFLYVGGGEF